MKTVRRSGVVTMNLTKPKPAATLYFMFPRFEIVFYSLSPFKIQIKQCFLTSH